MVLILKKAVHENIALFILLKQSLNKKGRVPQHQTRVHLDNLVSLIAKVTPLFSCGVKQALSNPKVK